MAEFSDLSPQHERRYHSYQGRKIPWYVRVMWVCFYLLAIFYCLMYVFPAIQREFRPSGGRSAERTRDTKTVE